MNRSWILIGAWAAILAAGFAVVFVLGAPLPTPAERLDAALHPSPPVSESAARQSAQTIVELQYPDFNGIEPTVERATDYDIDHWVITYSDTESLSGVLISIVVDNGTVEVTAFP